MNWFRKLLILLILVGQASYASTDWTLDASAVNNGATPDMWSLNFVLRNGSDKSAKTFASNLPWGIRSQLVLTAITLQEGSANFKAANYIDDPNFDPIEITPTQVMKGSVKLSERFPDLSTYKGKEPIAICYLYEFGQIVAGKPEVATGCVVFKRD